jgi:hypothetical protein
MLPKGASKPLLSKHRRGNAMRGKYIIIIVSAIICGAGTASWLAASQIGPRIQAATHLAAMAQLNAEEKAKAAELAQGISEAAERFAREELALERNTREAVEQALDKAVNRTAQAVMILAGQDNMTKNFEGDLADAEITKEELVLALAAQGTTKKAMESKLDDLNTILHLLDERIAKQVAARRQAQAELDNAKLRVQDLSSQLQQARIKADAKVQALAGNRAAKIKAREITSNRPQAEKRATLNSAQKQTARLPLPTQKPQVSWLQSLAP